MMLQNEHNMPQGKIETIMNTSETEKVERFLRQKFGNQDITLKARGETNDSVELLINDETMGIVFRDDEDGDICYHVQMTVLSEDLA